MFVTFTPEGSDPQEWELDPTDVLESHAERIERQYRKLTNDSGASYDMWQLGVYSGSSLARRVLLWHLIRLDHHGLKFEDLPDFRRKALKCEYSAGELRAMRARIEAKVKDPTSLEEALRQIDSELEDARESLDADESGKV